MDVSLSLRRSLSWGLVLGGVALAVVAVAAGNRIFAASPAATVGMTGGAFGPSSITVGVGQDVVWVNDDTNPHNVTSSSAVNGVSFYSGPLEPGDTFKRNFSEPGTYPYYCTYHPSMTGEVVVIDGPAPTATLATPPPPPPPPPGGGQEVVVFDNGYNPTSLSVAPGTQVRWTNAGGAPHTVASSASVNGVSFYSGILVEDPDGSGAGTGGAFAFTFNLAGTYEYYCTFHNGMNGTIVVTGGSPPPTTATPTSVPPTPTPVPPGPTPLPGSTNHTVQVGDNWFGTAGQSGSTPLITTVSVGDTITWNWASGVADHNVRGTDSGFGTNVPSGPFVTNAPIQAGPSTYGPLTFTTAGTFYYRCSLHPGEMRGQVIVTGPTPPPGSTPTPVPPTPTPTAVPPTSTPGGTPPPGGPVSHTVQVGDDWFGSSASSGGNVHVLSVATGDTVTWNWAAGVGDHNVRGTDSGFSTNVANGPFVTNAPIQSGPSTFGPLTFSAPGTYFYRCSLHPANMRGQITVTGSAPPGGGATPVPPTATATTVAPTATPGTSSGGAAHTVQVGDDWFGSSASSGGTVHVLSIATGDTVTWNWAAGVGDHNVRGTDSGFSTNVANGPFATNGPIQSGPNTFGPLTFGQPGTYYYRCSLHPANMRGQINVTGAASSGSPTPSAPSGYRYVTAGLPPGSQGVTVPSDFPQFNDYASFEAAVAAYAASHPGVFLPPNPYPRGSGGSGTTGTPTPPPGAVIVQVRDNVFAPVTTTVNAGTTVRWEWTGVTPHTVTSRAGGMFNSGILEQGSAFPFTFNTPGTYQYYCTLHTGMDGTITVTGTAQTPAPGSTAAPTVAPTATPPAPPPPAGATTVEVIDNAFSPGLASISAGTTVVWVWGGNLPHTVTARSGAFDSGIVMAGGQYRRTFDQGGTFEYYCILHPEMVGTVNVTGGSTAGGGAPPPPAPTPIAAPPPRPAAGGVNMVDNVFEPGALTVRAGATITWTNSGRLPHTVTAADGSFDSGIKMPGQLFSFNFAAPGTFNYTCILHPGMTGRIVVTDATGTAPPPRDPVDASVAATAEPSPKPAGSGTVSAEMVDNDFTPRQLTVRTGTTVRWVNAGQLPHTVTDRGLTFDSSIVVRGATFAHTFDKPGTYEIYCAVHPQMVGTVTVSDTASAGGSQPDGRAGAGGDARAGGKPTEVGGAPSLQIESGTGMDPWAKAAIWVTFVLGTAVAGVAIAFTIQRDQAQRARERREAGVADGREPA